MNQYKPMLAGNAAGPFNSKDWIFEIKWDGIRAISYINEKLSVKSRNNKELRQYFPELEELKTLTENAVLDGELVVMRGGKPDFQTLLERNKTTSTSEIRHRASIYPATYIIFDILEKDGKPLIDLPQEERKKLLQSYVKEGRSAILSMFVEEQGEAYFEVAMQKGLEGVIAKKKDSLYRPGIRSNNWLKIKKLKSCDCIIIGYILGKGSRRALGALILAMYDNGKQVYVGKVGTGFSTDDIESLLKAFKKLVVEEESSIAVDVTQQMTWLKPQLVCEVVYQSVTRDRRLRMPRYRGLRSDKLPAECTIDQLESGNLAEYVLKRDFAVTPEPRGTEPTEGKKRFVIQEHHARRLHYDLRLEKNGVLKSWAIPKGVPMKKSEKRLAVETEDHPLEYGGFEGTIPKGQYGAGAVRIWEKGFYEPKLWKEDMIEFSLAGDRLNGKYVLTRLKKAGEKQWLLLKVGDRDS